MHPWRRTTGNYKKYILRKRGKVGFELGEGYLCYDTMSWTAAQLNGEGGFGVETADSRW